MKFTWQVTNGMVEMNMIGLYLAMIGRLRQLSEPRLRQQAGIENSQTSVESVILVKWVRLVFIFTVLVVDLLPFSFTFHLLHLEFSS